MRDGQFTQAPVGKIVDKPGCADNPAIPERKTPSTTAPVKDTSCSSTDQCKKKADQAMNGELTQDHQPDYSAAGQYMLQAARFACKAGDKEACEMVKQMNAP